MFGMSPHGIYVMIIKMQPNMVKYIYEDSGKLIILVVCNLFLGLGQYNSLGEYCSLSTASEVFPILVFGLKGNQMAAYWSNESKALEIQPVRPTEVCGKV